MFFVVIAVAAPFLTPYNPTQDHNVGAPYSAPAWAAVLPWYQGSPVTGYLVNPVDFGALRGVGDWTVNAAPNASLSQGVSSDVPPSGPFLPRTPTGSLVLNATLSSTEGKTPNILLPGGKAFFTMSQTFDLPKTSTPPQLFAANVTLEVGKMVNVSQVYINYLISGPTGVFRLSTSTGIIRYQVVILPTQVGKWATSSVQDRLLPSSGIPEFAQVNHPSQKVFAVAGTYNYTIQILAVPTGANPSVSVKVASASLKTVGSLFGVLGTDDTGRDIWAQFIYGSRISLLIGIASGIGAVVLGAIIGIASGYLGGFWDELLSRVTDFVLILPFLPLLIVITLILTQNTFLRSTITWWVILVFTILSWPTIAKIIRSQVLSVKERSYVEASRALGGGTSHVLRKHLLPNVTGLVYSQVALNVSGFILLEAALDFLTVTLYPSTVITWGLMLTDSLNNAVIDSVHAHVWWWFFPPGIAIAALSLAFVMVGFALDQVFNPRLRAR
jgi:peptide/nickel transport system permease protein